MKILVTGGAGYVGCVLVKALRNFGHSVVVYDNLMYGGQGLLGVIGCPKVEFVEGDVRDTIELDRAATGCDLIIHLAAVVGYPACNKSPAGSFQINSIGTKRVCEIGVPVIFGSTQSVYGKQEGLVTEETACRPGTYYASGKRSAEYEVVDRGDSVVFRFPTLFGVSPRMRWDLLVNDFTQRAVLDGTLVVYQPDAIRPILHVADAVSFYLMAVDGKFAPGVYNVGHDSLVITKRQLCMEIAQYVNLDVTFKEFATDKDQRDYRIDFSKLDFSPSRSLGAGIRELVKAVPLTRERKWRNA